MKKTVFLLVLLGSALFYVFFDVQKNLNKSLDENYIASRVQGDVFYQPQGSESPLKLSVGSGLKKGDLITTGTDGEVDLLFTNGQALRLKPGSTVRLMTGKAASSVHVSLLDGKVMSLANQPYGILFKIDTPIITMQGDDASFLVEHSEVLRLSSLVVSEGKLDVEITGDETQATDIGGGNKLENIKISTEQFIKQELNDIEWTYVENEVADIPAAIDVQHLLMDFFTGRLSVSALEKHASVFNR